ncbi:unnamed protein product (macronuclear) [Paramecium tetraurelia]|uniref:Uncharacterized protein n=1 Tax=Paramecium tetraurelia TaxID=5888 RepID=A0BQ30_PARTE|nr:uncharacterized protein GSPATT00005398001 [Paramecium tetraurelia]CAK60647.1 unnamed protein product [Paramecium tetraurelia]|eukprot:XP_001428045.1 hypothetical protein (macronuclear) [Paramecium tetraurelia strain d4-2]
MPPKTQKQKEEEAARLAEEQRMREEEEERQRKELEKYKISTLNNTKQFNIFNVSMPLPITKYCIEYVFPHSESHKAMMEYLHKLAEIYNCKDQLRDIDFQISADVLINDLIFAKSLNNLNDESVQVLINILFLSFTNNNSKFSQEMRFNNTLQQKTKISDAELFNHLLKVHAEAGYFRSMHILPIKEHFQIYLNHFDLINQAFISDQRTLELHMDLQMDLPLQPLPLDEALIYRPFEQKDEDDGLIETVDQEDQQAPPEPTDEELLDPIIMDAIQKKLDLAKQELEEKLVSRQKDMEEKLMSMATKKK